MEAGVRAADGLQGDRQANRQLGQLRQTCRVFNDGLINRYVEFLAYWLIYTNYLLGIRSASRSVEQPIRLLALFDV